MKNTAQTKEARSLADRAIETTVASASRTRETQRQRTPHKSVWAFAPAIP